jgi:hypothetical protein
MSPRVVTVDGNSGISPKYESLSCEGGIMEVIVEWYIECFCSAKFSGGIFLENFFEEYCVGNCVDRKGLDG